MPSHEKYWFDAPLYNKKMQMQQKNNYCKELKSRNNNVGFDSDDNAVGVFSVFSMF